jgi:hypothetical protein
MGLDFSSEAYFLTSVLSVTLVTLAYSGFKMWRQPETNLGRKENKKIYLGVVIFVGVGLLVAIPNMVRASTPNHLHWFQYGEVYLGLDQTKGRSVFCENRGVNRYLTSNGGVVFNILQSNDRRFSLNAKYIHHSCAYSPDEPTYDAIGLSATLRFFSRY